MAVETTIQYLKRDKLYEVEKPFNVEFEPDRDGDIQRSNLISWGEPVTVNTIQLSDEFDMDTSGFCVIRKEIPLDAEKARRDPESVEAAFLEELEATLARRFPEYRRIEPLEFLVRCRDEKFPSQDKMLADYEQPARLAHSDYTPLGALLQLKSSFPGQEKYFEDREFDMINVWRPLVGPTDDWPLALCDYASISPDKDITVGDTIHPDGISENQLLHANKRHRWYYIEGQKTSDLLVFRNTDSTGRRAKAFHAAFQIPNSRGPPRQSCEVRFVAFR